MSQQATLLSSATCDSGDQPANFCPSTGLELVPSVIGLLPQGPVWEPGRTPGTTQYKTWLAFADVLAWIYSLFCSYMLEFHCNTADTSIDQWAKEYDLYNDCDSYGHNLCAKVTAEGGQTCEYLQDQALLSGWVIECEPAAPLGTRPIAGCMMAGCVQAGPKPELAGLVIQDGITCLDYGGVVNHPDKALWPAEISATDKSCPIPGSGTGIGPGTLPGMSCRIAGYYTLDHERQDCAPPTSYTSCEGDNKVIVFCCNTQVFQPQMKEPTDSTGRWRMGYADIYTLKVKVDIGASFALQQKPVPTGPASMGGRFMAGCTPVCSPPALDIECILEQIAPAHCELVFDFVQPA